MHKGIKIESCIQHRTTSLGFLCTPPFPTTLSDMIIFHSNLWFECYPHMHFYSCRCLVLIREIKNGARRVPQRKTWANQVVAAGWPLERRWPTGNSRWCTLTKTARDIETRDQKPYEAVMYRSFMTEKLEVSRIDNGGCSHSLRAMHHL